MTRQVARSKYVTRVDGKHDMHGGRGERRLDARLRYTHTHTHYVYARTTSPDTVFRRAPSPKGFPLRTAWPGEDTMQQL